LTLKISHAKEDPKKLGEGGIRKKNFDRSPRTKERDIF